MDREIKGGAEKRKTLIGRVPDWRLVEREERRRFARQGAAVDRWRQDLLESRCRLRDLHDHNLRLMALRRSPIGESDRGRLLIFTRPSGTRPLCSRPARTWFE